MNPPLGLFFTGTDTDVGKTYVAALVAQQLTSQGVRVGVYKPAASGCRVENGELVADDAVALWEAVGRVGDLTRVCPQKFSAPLAPHLAAADEGRSIDVDLLYSGLQAWQGECDIVLVEGVGGLMSPLADEAYVADLAFQFGYPLVVVALNKIGVINQTIQTLITAAAFEDGIPIAGIVLNDNRPDDITDPSRESNAAELIKHCVPPLLTQVKWGANKPVDELDWLSLAEGVQVGGGNG